MELIVDSLGPPATARKVEIVERKGLGHPDTICDSVAATIGLALCRHYRERFGAILHHNVDKALLAAGTSRAAFRGGRVISPIELFVAGRATREVDGDLVPVEELATGACRRWLRTNLHALDERQHVRVTSLIKPGSPDLVQLYRRGAAGGALLANDTSIGVGHAPLSPLERAVLAVSERLREVAHGEWPEVGEDTKVMAVRVGERVRLTVACAFVGHHLADMEQYLERRERVRAMCAATAGAILHGEVAVEVNAGDEPARGSVFLTVTGTSAESGDDGEVGRGNRVSGLITPYHPMTLEAAAGKNPVTHVGLLYNVVARRIAAAVVEHVTGVDEAHCFLVSRIGQPISEPEVANVRIAGAFGPPTPEVAARIEEIARDQLAHIGRITDAIVDGTIPLC